MMQNALSLGSPGPTLMRTVAGLGSVSLRKLNGRKRRVGQTSEDFRGAMKSRRTIKRISAALAAGRAMACYPQSGGLRLGKVPSVSMISRATYGNGSPTGMTQIITKKARNETRQGLPEVKQKWCGATRGG